MEVTARQLHLLARELSSHPQISLDGRSSGTFRNGTAALSIISEQGPEQRDIV
ncbi:hypothetical protein ACVXHB_13315 [Escherichia coli]